jgi:DNA-directed RNA polymerase specialized sigma24 family protein
MEVFQSPGSHRADYKTVLEIEPSLVLLGPHVRAMASLRSGDRSPLPRELTNARWGLFGAGNLLGESPALNLPIDFPVPPLVGDVPIEAYRLTGRARELFLARGRLIVLGTREQILERALKESDEADGLAIFRYLARLPWPDESTRLENFRLWLEPSAGVRSARGRRAFAFLMELHEKPLERMVRGMAKNYGRAGHDTSEELMSRLIVSLWENWENFDPGRGSFQSWAQCHLRTCRGKYHSELKKQQRIVESLGEAVLGWDPDGTTRLVDREEGRVLTEKLRARFPELKVKVYLMRMTETPQPTLLEIAERFKIQVGADRKAREAVVRRILDAVEDHVRFIQRNGGIR